MLCSYSAFIHVTVSGINNSYTEAFPFRYLSEYEVTRTVLTGIHCWWK